jgi:hypothetical protein
MKTEQNMFHHKLDPERPETRINRTIENLH